jgi:hypothetical protein
VSNGKYVVTLELQSDGSWSVKHGNDPAVGYIGFGAAFYRAETVALFEGAELMLSEEAQAEVDDRQLTLDV